MLFLARLCTTAFICTINPGCRYQWQALSFNNNKKEGEEEERERDGEEGGLTILCQFQFNLPVSGRERGCDRAGQDRTVDFVVSFSSPCQFQCETESLVEAQGCQIVSVSFSRVARIVL